MIKNSHELNITKKIIIEFEERLSQLKSLKHSVKVDNEILSIKSIINDLNLQILRYKDTINHVYDYQTINSLDELSFIITGRRIELGISQEQLAEKIGIPYDDYLILEDNDFFGINPSVFSKIISLLKINNPNNIITNNYTEYIGEIEKNINALNISKQFLLNLLPISLESVKKAITNKRSSANYLVNKFLEIFKKLFSIDLTKSITDDTLKDSYAVAFKRQINTNADYLNFITMFAAHAAWICSKQIISPSNKIKADPIVVRNNILLLNNTVSLDSCLEYIWGLNIAILPLNIKSGFHGACFDFLNKKVIALNKQNDLISRWKFNLLHELYHALTMDYNTYIERTDIMEQNEGEEKNASEFASFVIFGQEVDSYVQLVLEMSNENALLIKKNTAIVSKDYNLDIDDFSNFVAYRISKHPLNFWGTALNLQTDTRSAHEIVRNFLLKKIDYNKLDNEDISIFQNALFERMEL